MKSVYVDITALEALINTDHPHHDLAKTFLSTIQARRFALVSARQTLFVLADKLKRKHLGQSSNQIIDALYRSKIILFEPMNSEDEMESWQIYKDMNTSWWTFLHCVSMALINRLEIQSVFGFEPGYRQVGLNLLPEEYNR